MNLNPSWIPYLKLNYIYHKIGFVIPWNYMEQIKNYYQIYNEDQRKENYIYSAFTADFHCGITDRNFSNGFLLINKIVFHSTSHKELIRGGVPSHRCLWECEHNEKTFFSINRTSKNNRCGQLAHPEYKTIHHPLYKINDRNIRVEECGYAFSFEFSLTEFIHELSSCYSHINLDHIDWNKTDIGGHSLRSYLNRNNIVTLSINNNQKRRKIKLILPKRHTSQKLNAKQSDNNISLITAHTSNTQSVHQKYTKPSLQRRNTRKRKTPDKQQSEKIVIHTHSVCLDPVQKELVALIHLPLICTRFKKQLIRVCMRYGVTKPQAMRQIQYLKQNPNAKNWNTIKALPNLDVSIYSDDDTEDEFEELHCSLEFAKQHLRDKYKTSSNLNDIYNKKYNALHLLKQARNEL